LDSIEKIRSQRFAFLMAVYEDAEARMNAYVAKDKVATKLGFDRTFTDAIVMYLADEGLLEWVAQGFIQLTHSGINEIEEVLTTRTEPTEHFPAYVVAQNYIHIGSMQGSQQIQQGTQGSTQAQQSFDVEALRSLVAEIRHATGTSELSNDQAREVDAELATVEAQLGSPRPKASIIRESLSTVRAIFEGGAGSALGAGVKAAAPHVVTLIQQALALLPG
jgi:hypothetical protein